MSGSNARRDGTFGADDHNYFGGKMSESEINKNYIVVMRNSLMLTNRTIQLKAKSFEQAAEKSKAYQKPNEALLRITCGTEVWYNSKNTGVIQ